MMIIQFPEGWIVVVDIIVGWSQLCAEPHCITIVLLVVLYDKVQL